MNTSKIVVEPIHMNLPPVVLEAVKQAYWSCQSVRYTIHPDNRITCIWVLP